MENLVKGFPEISCGTEVPHKLSCNGLVVGSPESTLPLTDGLVATDLR